MKKLYLTFGIVLVAFRLQAQQISPGAIYAASNSASAGGVSLDWVLGSINTQPELSVLPVKLISFEGQLTSTGDAEIHWKTAGESGNKGFELQKSTDGKIFEKIAWIDGAGDSNTEKDYHFTDRELRTTSYYRLKQFDWIGSFSMSRIISVVPAFESITQFSVYPNPSPDGNVQIKLPERTSMVSLVDSKGINVMQQANPSKENTFKLPVSGLYLLTVKTATEQKTIKIIRR
ncbi:T9SS type A sorting domain-containing protein [Dyadobacter luticola]|uniref:T9SS type A sorting domain-containing protein n=1 Tax=Dyadobacter luticola TaxID=1979387 RepID=A0A5R9L614_9BACT|nr:T9SS type A sorting domain-containing protein [Dyadobacter luticola]TLV03888.1 T9SS type A sorting domain-containing protein [Dyadobacter luticola]